MWHERQKTYGEELRSLPLEELTPSELRRLQAERAWEQANPTEVAALDALVGQRVALKQKRDGKHYVTWAESLPLGERRVPDIMGALIPTHIRAGRSFLIVSRLGDRLLGIDAVGDAWLLRREWLQVVHRVQKTKLEEVRLEGGSDALDERKSSAQ